MFPDELARPTFASGWRLAEGETWDAEKQETGVDLVSLSLASRSVTVVLEITADESRRLAFPDVGDFHVDGTFTWGTTDYGSGDSQSIVSKQRRRAQTRVPRGATHSWASRPSAAARCS